MHVAWGKSSIQDVCDTLAVHSRGEKLNDSQFQHRHLGMSFGKFILSFSLPRMSRGFQLSTSLTCYLSFWAMSLPSRSLRQTMYFLTKRYNWGNFEVLFLFFVFCFLFSFLTLAKTHSMLLDKGPIFYVNRPKLQQSVEVD